MLLVQNTPTLESFENSKNKYDVSYCQQYVTKDMSLKNK